MRVLLSLFVASSLLFSGMVQAQPQPQGLPQGHPPIQRPGKAQPPARRVPKREQQARMREMIAKAKAEAPKKAHGKKDAHGYCLGDGPNDRPKGINLLHGWLGVNNEKAVAPPRLAPYPNFPWYDVGEHVARFKAQSPYWKWRLTPYPYRYENHDDHCDRRNQPVPLVANVINLAALLFIMFRFGRKPLAEALRRRRDGIMSEIDKAEEIHRKAEERLFSYRQELDELDDRLVSLREQYAAEGEMEEKRLREDMAEVRDRMIADANFQVSQESKTAEAALSREALEGALSAAEQLLGKSVTDDDHDRLADEYLDQIAAALGGTA